jgi:PilZ domain
MSSERRRSPRVEILGRLHGQVVSLDVQVVVREISLGGLSLETPVPLPNGAEHEFRLTLGDESTVLLRGRVVHCHESVRADGRRAYVSGVQFVDEEPPDGDSSVGRLIDRFG